MYDAVIVGSGPNGLTAGAILARAGWKTLVVERGETPGGGSRTQELTLPGFRHDPCASVHPLGASSPIFRELDLVGAGLEWIHAATPLAHVEFDRVVTLERSIEETVAQFDRDDAVHYRRLFEPFLERSAELVPMVLAPLHFPRHPILFARFGLRALRSMHGLARRFAEPYAGAMLGGIAAHAMVPLDRLATASFAMVMGLAGHTVGWPLARGGSKAIIDALLVRFREAGGELELGHDVRHIDELPKARAYLFDVTPRQLLAIAGDRLPARYRRRLERFRYGPGIYKIDWALSGPVPFADPACRRALTVHLRRPNHPFTLFVQPTLVDPSRAPPGRHIAWAYVHVPNGVEIDAAQEIEAHIESVAPGFRELILARATKDPLEMQAFNPNYIGGDINGGFGDLAQLFFRPVIARDPYATPAKDIFLCSSSTPPGGGVHGMCGYHAARSVLKRVSR